MIHLFNKTILKPNRFSSFFSVSAVLVKNKGGNKIRQLSNTNRKITLLFNNNQIHITSGRRFSSTSSSSNSHSIDGVYKDYLTSLTNQASLNNGAIRIGAYGLTQADKV